MVNLAYSNFSVGHSNAGLLEYVMGVLDDMERDACAYPEYPQMLREFIKHYGIDEFTKLSPNNNNHWNYTKLDEICPCFASDAPEESYDSAVAYMYEDMERDIKSYIAKGEPRALSQNPIGFYDFEICWETSSAVLESPRNTRFVMLTIAEQIEESFREENNDSYFGAEIYDYFETRDFDKYIEGITEDVETMLSEDRAYNGSDDQEIDMLREALMDVSHSMPCCIPIMSEDEGFSGYGFDAQESIYEHFEKTGVDTENYMFLYNSDQNILFPEFLKEDLEFFEKDGVFGNNVERVRILPRQRAKEFSSWARNYHESIANMQKELVLRNDK